MMKALSLCYLIFIVMEDILIDVSRLVEHLQSHDIIERCHVIDSSPSYIFSKEV